MCIYFFNITIYLSMHQTFPTFIYLFIFYAAPMDDSSLFPNKINHSFNKFTTTVNAILNFPRLIKCNLLAGSESKIKIY